MNQQLSLGLSRPKATYVVLAAIFGIVEGAVFVITQFTTLAADSQSVLGQIVLYGMFIVVIICAAYATFHGESVATALILSIGPVAGFLAYLIGYHLVYPPSTDSPTWLIFLTLAVVFVGAGLAGYRVGHHFRPT